MCLWLAVIAALAFILALFSTPDRQEPPAVLLLVRNSAAEVEGAVRLLEESGTTELVVLDRGSDDETPAILHRLQRTYPDIVLREGGSPGPLDLLAAPVSLVVRLDRPEMDLGTLRRFLAGWKKREGG